MPRIGQVIIGSAFGDEGKGLLTDYRVSQSAGSAIVVRANGGAQAGHTVQTPDGRRHVFHHLGAGSFLGAPTFLSRFFIANPLLLTNELEALAGLGVTPRYHVDPAAPLTTPFDMMINQMAEEARGRARHGSCGYGINETITRNENPAFATSVRDLIDPKGLAMRLTRIRDTYVPARLATLGLTANETWARRLAGDGLIPWFLDAGQKTLLPAMATQDILSSAETVVFEGAQGLLLDEHHRYFPHVTRSRTGLPNVLTLAAELGLNRLEVTYGTRAYATRHGAGPFPREEAGMRAPKRWSKCQSRETSLSPPFRRCVTRSRPRAGRRWKSPWRRPRWQGTSRPRASPHRRMAPAQVEPSMPLE